MGPEPYIPLTEAEYVEVSRMLGVWITRAVEAQERATYYRNILAACAAAIGPEAYTTNGEGEIPDWEQLPTLMKKRRRRRRTTA